MAFIYCPECGNETSDASISCPNCGRPLHAIPPPKSVVISPERRSDIPNWMLISLGAIAGVVVIAFLYVMLREGKGNQGMDVEVVANRQQSARQTDRPATSVPGSSTTVPSSAPVMPPASSDSQTVTVPGTGVTAAPPARGSVVVNAKVRGRNGETRPVRNEKFYLLDKDLETILFDAGLEPIEGRSLANSFGLSVTFPDRYGDFQRKALAAIRPHIKHSAVSDTSGKAAFGNIEPDSYYLFGVTRGDGSFALWSSPVSILPGQNVLELSPQVLSDVG